MQLNSSRRGNHGENSVSKGAVIFAALLAVGICHFVTHPPAFLLTEEQKFVAFTEEIFCGELSGNTLNLHYLVADPSTYGLDEISPTIGSASVESREEDYIALENYRAALKAFDYEKLSDERKLTYDVFLEYLNTELDAEALLLYDEPLGPALGIQAQLPILLAEYSFRTKGDIEDYLTLIAQIPDYFDSVLSFEQEKSKAGLFMSSDCALAVIEQCLDFVSDTENHYLIETFDEKIDRVSNLTTDEKIAYKSRNQSVLTEYVFPAYRDLAAALAELEDTGSNEMGLYYYPEGRAYYEYLIKSRVGDSRSVEDIEEAVKAQMVSDYAAMQEIFAGQAENAENGGERDEENSAYTEEAAAIISTAAEYADSDPAAMLEDLRRKITADFPLLTNVSYEIKYVHESLQEYLSPAFYLTPAIDDYTENVIYINPAGGYSGLELYTTLAHEGYPGHLYQSVYFASQSPDLIRLILNVSGYTEGWATYVELYAYSLYDGDATEAAIGRLNRSFTLGVAALLDIGIHYRGYTPEEVSDFLTRLGFTESTAKSLYTAILEAPANYLQYYVGCLNFQSLCNSLEEATEDFSLKEFHRAVLETGPVPFDILEEQCRKRLME